MIKDILLKGLTPEQIAKVQACDNLSDLLQLAKDEEVELTEEQLNAVNGGACSDSSGKKKDDNGQRKIES